MEEQSLMNEAIVKAVAEVTRVMIQTIVETQPKDQKVNKDPC